MRPTNPITVPHAFAQARAAYDDARADYLAGRATRFTRQRTGLYALGSAADYHYRSEQAFLKMIEYAADMMRNDACPGAILDRAVWNIHQNGFRPEPRPGGSDFDSELGDDLRALWEDWADDAQACDVQSRFAFNELAELALRTAKGIGDAFVLLPTNGGALQLVEGYRCRTPLKGGKAATTRRVIHGVWVDGKRRPLEYWFTKDDIDPWRGVDKVSEMDRRPAFDADGNPRVLHVCDPKRVTQTRGVSQFAPVMQMLGMFDDLNFANLVRAQLAACYLTKRERPERGLRETSTPQGGARQSGTLSDGVSYTEERVQPGIDIIGAPGEKIEVLSAAIPRTEYFQHALFTLRIVGACLNVPMVAYLLDGTQTNFSGWRGAISEARIGWRRDQVWLRNRFHIPIYRWKLRQWIAKDRALRKAYDRLGESIFACRWTFPRWPYIQPEIDAKTDQLREQALHASPRRVHDELGQHYRTEMEHAVADNAYRIELAVAAAAELSERLSKRLGRMVHIDPRQLLVFMREEPLELEPKTDQTRSEKEAAEELTFKREVVKAFINDGTIGDVMFNRVAAGKLLHQVNIPVWTDEGGNEIEEPWLPTVAAQGYLISGQTIEHEGEIVGGAILGGSGLVNYAVGIRSGALTAQRDDEAYFRQHLNLPAMNEQTTDDWERGARRPITLADTEEREHESPATGSEQTNPAAGGGGDRTAGDGDDGGLDRVGGADGGGLPAADAGQGAGKARATVSRARARTAAHLQRTGLPARGDGSRRGEAGDEVEERSRDREIKRSRRRAGKRKVKTDTK